MPNADQLLKIIFFISSNAASAFRQPTFLLISGNLFFHFDKIFPGYFSALASVGKVSKLVISFSNATECNQYFPDHQPYSKRHLILRCCKAACFRNPGNHFNK